MTTNVNFEEIKDLSAGDIAKKVGTGEITDLSTEDKQSLLDFSKLDPSARENFIKDRNGVEDPPPGPGEDPPPAEDPPPEDPPPPPQEDPPPKSDDPIPPGEDPPPVEEPEDKTVDLLKMLDAKETELQKHRSSARTSGTKSQELQTALDEANTKLKEFEDSHKTPPTPPPEPPKRPVVNDFDQGVIDEGYTEAMTRYDKDILQHQTDVAEYNKTHEPENVTALRDEVKTLKETIEGISSFTQQEQQKTAKVKIDKGWSGMWGHAREIQNSLELKTSIPVETINTYAYRETNPLDKAGNPVYSEQELSDAKAFLSKLPDGDMANYKKIAPLINDLYNCDGGIPEKRYANFSDNKVIENAVERHKIDINPVKLVEFTAADRADALSKKQKLNEKSVSGMPADKMGGGDDPLADPAMKEEKQKKLMSMARTAKNNPGLIIETNAKYDPKFVEKFEKLKLELYPRK